MIISSSNHKWPLILRVAGLVEYNLETLAFHIVKFHYHWLIFAGVLEGCYSVKLHIP